MRKGLFIIILVLILSFIALKVMLIGKGLTNSNAKHLYLITVDDRNNPSTHIADSILFESERCIEFRNEFGMIQKECGDRISKTTYK